MNKTTQAIILALSLLLIGSLYGQKKSTQKNQDLPLIDKDSVRYESLDITDVIAQTISAEDADDDSHKSPLSVVEQMPLFPGGEKAMMKYIGDSLHYPQSAQEAGIQGRVIVRFVVDKNGRIREVVVMRGIDPLCDEEVVRVINSMPKWIPAMQSGVTVPAYFILPVVFRLPSTSDKIE